MLEDEDMLLTLAEEVRQREEQASWTQAEERLAAILEQLSLHRIERLAVAGVKKDARPDPISVPRPHRVAQAKSSGARRVSPAEGAKLMMGAL